jgi:two-component system sensor histidine kinase ChvG
MTRLRLPRLARVHRSLRARLSRIGMRLLMFNVLAAVMPVAGVLYLDVYEQELLLAQERGMVQQARLVAAALASGGAGATSGAADVVSSPPASDAESLAAAIASTAEPPGPGTDLPVVPPSAQVLDGATARNLLTRLTPGDARIRVYDLAGLPVADSARLSPRTDVPPSASYDEVGVGTRDEWLYRLGSWIAANRRRMSAWLRPRLSTPATSGPATGVPPEVRMALGGRFGAATRPTPGQRSLTLTVALPVNGSDGVAGAVTVSQSTYRILQALYTIRLRIFRIVVATLALSGLISAVLGLTIVWPIRRLRRAALSLARGDRRVPTHFPGIERRDEVGDLARALEESTRRLQAHVTLLESFAGDVAHEFRNPLASIRTALDVVQDTSDPEERERFLAMARRDIARLDRLVLGVRDLARIDSAIEREDVEPVDIGPLLGSMQEHRRIAVTVTPAGDGPLLVRANPDRLWQVIENLVGNAESFSPEPGSVTVEARADGEALLIKVSDRGPGIPAAHRDRVFERFFSYRPASAVRHEHAGLGLSIARAIVEAYGGTIATRDRDGGGTSFEVRLPRAR